MLHLEVSRIKQQNTNPHPDGKLFVDLNGPGILRDTPYKDPRGHAIYCRNAWVLEMQNFTQAYTKGWTYLRMIFSQPKFSDPWCSAARALRGGSAIILF